MKNLFILVLSYFFIINANGQATGNYKYKGNAQKPRAAANYNYNNTNNKQTPNASTATTSGNNMTLQVRTLKNVKADAYTAIFNVVQLGPTAEKTDELMNKRLDAFRSAAIKLGIPANDFVIDILTFVPIYGYEVDKRLFSKNHNEVPKGFELQKNVHIRFTRPSQLDQLISVATKNEIYDLVKVEYYVKDIEKVYEELRLSAIKHLQKRMKTYEMMGIKLDTLYRTISEFHNSHYPYNRYQQYQAFTRGSVESFKKRDNITNIRQPITQFYNKLDYEKYDIVLNPEIVEPAVQFTLEMSVVFTLKPPSPRIITKTENKKEFYWMTPDGELKQMKVE